MTVLPQSHTDRCSMWFSFPEEDGIWMGAGADLKPVYTFHSGVFPDVQTGNSVSPDARPYNQKCKLLNLGADNKLGCSSVLWTNLNLICQTTEQFTISVHFELALA